MECNRLINLRVGFQATNHGISSSFLEKMRKISEQFFSLPIEEKMRYGREVDGMEGYGNDLIFSNQQILDWSDRLYLVTNPKDERRLEFWPLNPPSFRSV